MGPEGGAMTDTPNPAALEDLEEDHEKYAGEVIADPWDDDEQKDWPTGQPMLDVDADEED